MKTARMRSNADMPRVTFSDLSITLIAVCQTTKTASRTIQLWDHRWRAYRSASQLVLDTPQPGDRKDHDSHGGRLLVLPTGRVLMGEMRMEEG